ncbi:hypothetical protein H105_00166 [Trichophyton soudanense CBS 452.61]|uniref:Uncharacterized protein n=1 Tax=Trichophyton soudanense CBS 452.61 TaxID=1215331 RepID=A0A022Y8R7_TRISD|nr:hypothetical protein H105_00166 [Trichophyton soudanense CBS 452.61]
MLCCGITSLAQCKILYETACGGQAQVTGQAATRAAKGAKGERQAAEEREDLPFGLASSESSESLAAAVYHSHSLCAGMVQLLAGLEQGGMGTGEMLYEARRPLEYASDARPWPLG